MNSESISNIIDGAREKQIRPEEIEKGLREGTIMIDANRISEIAEKLKNEGRFNAGDELREKAFEIYKKELINRKLKDL